MIMPLKVVLSLVAIFSLRASAVHSRTDRNDRSYDYLSACWQKQCGALHAKYLHVSYSSTSRQLYHSFDPWQTITNKLSGNAWFDAGMFEKSDSSRSANGRVSLANVVFDSTALLASSSGDSALIPVTKDNWFSAMFESAKYSPLILLDYFNRRSTEATLRTDSGLANYSLTINKTVVTLSIRMSDSLIQSVRMRESDDLLGDVEDIYRYRSYRNVNGVSIPDSTETEKYDGKLRGGVRIRSAQIVDQAPTLIAKPANFKFTEEKIKTPDIRVHKFSDHIYLIDLIHTDCRSMLVEFSDFLLVVDAPLASKNGEMVISEAKKIAPDKTIRYFAFGHHHPGFIGGIRPFIFRGATILTRAEDTPYVNFLAEAPHALDPDSLYLHPRAMRTQEIGDSLTISDGRYDMKIYYIGKKSRHTSDYVIFYFPGENVVWDDDLAWVKRNAPLEKAIERQAGLVNAIKDLGLHPLKVIQSCPLAEYGVKTIIPFDDLEASMNVKLGE
jgi:hypothetical protein